MMDDSPAPGDEFDLGQTIARFRTGLKIFGRYTLERQLGRGGMGVVWLAHDHSLERHVAFKFLPEIMLQDRGALDDLREETRRNLEITHPHIVRIYDFEEDESLAGIAMEYVDGETLAARRAAQPQRIFEAQDLFPWLKDLCEALHYAHTDPRVVHRDLKPANLMLSARGQLKITDFGIARSITDSVSRVSNAHSSGGTLAYMSPQQLLGIDSTPADDIYSVGATLYDLLTSKPPFFTGSIAHQIQHVTPPRMAARRGELKRSGAPIPEAWEETVQACLAKKPEERPASMLEIYDRLQSGGTSGGTRRKSEEAPLPPEQGKMARRIGIVAAVALIMFLAAYAWRTIEKSRELRLEQEKALLTEQKRRDEGALPASTPVSAPKPETPKPAIPTKGRIIVNTVPSRAAVYLDGRSVGVSSVVLEEVSVGLSQIRMSLDGYEPAELTVEVSGGQTIEKTIHLVARKPVNAAAMPPIAVPATPAPVPMPPPPVASGLGDDQAREFVQFHLLAIEKSDLGSLANCYADPVDYHDEGRLSGSALRRSLEEYRRQWPSIDIGELGPIKVGGTANPDVKTVTYSYFFVARNPGIGKISQGWAHDTLTVRNFNGRVLIIRFRQTVTSRKKNF